MLIYGDFTTLVPIRDENPKQHQAKSNPNQTESNPNQAKSSQNQVRSKSKSKSSQNRNQNQIQNQKLIKSENPMNQILGGPSKNPNGILGNPNRIMRNHKKSKS